MPLYSYDCDRCGTTVELINPYRDRDRAIECLELTVDGSRCPGALRRHGVELFTQGKPSFQTNAIGPDGSKTAGQFGKSGRKAKGWHRP